MKSNLRLSLDIEQLTRMYDELVKRIEVLEKAEAARIQSAQSAERFEKLAEEQYPDDIPW